MQASDIAIEGLRSALRQDAPELMLGTVLAALGLLALAVFLGRRKLADRSLLWFAAFTGAYGVRLLVVTPVFGFATEPIPGRFWRYVGAAITYALPWLGTLFVRELFPGWARVLRWVTLFCAAFLVAGLLMDLTLQRPGSVQRWNNVLVIAAFLALQVSLYRYAGGERLRAIKLGSVVFFATVLFVNLWTLDDRALPASLRMLEPAGFTCFLAGLGTMVVRRFVEREEQLIEVNKELDVARRIQASILPAGPPGDAHVTIAARYLTMTAVAGDFYDYLEPGDGKIGLLVADVSGHGVPAALIASMVKVAISAQLGCAHDPGQVLAGMNRILCGKMQGQFVSAAYLFLDFEAEVMRYGAAGHPPLLACEGETVEAITENGLLLGLLPHSAYQATERKLKAGSRYLLYTDGLLEASDGSEQFFGAERVEAALRETRRLTAEESVQLLIDRVRAWSGARQQDDLTAVLVDVRAVGGTTE